jgi:hypothetical protein
MSDTVTYPTPAADELAATKPRLTEEIEAYRVERTQYWNQVFTVEQLHDTMESLDVRALPKSTPKPVLVAVLVDEYDMKQDDEFVAAAELRALERRADEERYILAGISDNTVEAVNEHFRSEIGSRLAGFETGLLPETLADLGEQWQEAKEYAAAWRFVGISISRHGRTPHEAARLAVQHFTAQVIQHARGNGQAGSVRVRRGMEARQYAAYAKFLDRLTILDGIVSAEGA